MSTLGRMRTAVGAERPTAVMTSATAGATSAAASVSTAGSGALARMGQAVAKQTARVTERTDKPDKPMVPVDRQEQSALAAEAAHKAFVPPADRQERSAIKAEQAHQATQTPRATTPAVTPVSTPKAAQRSGNYNLQSLPDLGRRPSRAAATEAPIKSGWADERVWDRQISIGRGPVKTPKASTLPLTQKPPALTLFSATDNVGALTRMAQAVAKQTARVTERTDEPDKPMVPVDRQEQSALAAEAAHKAFVPPADRQERSAIKAEQAHQAFAPKQAAQTAASNQQEGRSRPVEIDMPKQVVTQEEWAAQQWNALTQKINDAQTKLDAANARYASVARYGTVEDRIALRTEIKDLEQQIKDLEKERGDPNLLERIEKTLSGSAKLYGAQFLGVDEWLSNVEQSYQEWKEDAGIPSGSIKDGSGGRVWGEEPTAESARKQAEYVQTLGSNLKESGAADVERAKEGLDGLGSTIVDIGVAGSQMLGDVGLGIVTGGGSMLPMMLRSFGGGVQEAREKGYNVAQQTGLGLASAATEYFTERLFDGNPAYDKDGLINKLVERVAGDGKLVSALSSVPAEIISEGLEEVIADILEPISEKVLTGNWTGYDVEQIIHDGIVGMALGGLGQGGQYVAGRVRGTVDVARGGSETQKTTSPEAAAKAAQAVEELGAKPSEAQTVEETNRLPGYSEQDVARREQLRTAERVARKFGAELEVAELPSGVDGEYRDGKITISPRATNPVMTVAVHELTHHMESSSRYGEFSRMVLDYVSDEMGVDVDAVKNAIRSEYAKGGFALDDVGAERELVAKFVESKLFQDEAAINRLARTNRSMLQTVKDWISDMVVKLTGTEEEKFFRNAERLYEKALREVGDTTNSNGGQTQYSIEKTPDGKKYVRADRLVMFGNDPDSWSEQLEDYINGKIRKGQNVPLITANGDVLLLTGTSAGKMADNHRSNGTSLSDAEFERKVNAASHIDELVEVAKKANYKPKADKGSRHGGMASGGWDYYEAFFEDFDGKYYLVTISAAIGEDGTVVYNVGQMQERDPSAINGSSANGGAQNEKASFDERPPSAIDGSSANGGALRGKASFGDRITFDASNVKEGLSGESSGADSTSYADTLREMQQPGARQSKSYADDLAHVNELLQNAALSPRDRAYIQEDIADAQRRCDAAVKAIADPNATAEERAQAVRRAIDALDYARQRVNDLGLPATQLGVSMAQDALANLSEKLKRYLLE